MDLDTPDTIPGAGSEERLLYLLKSSGASTTADLAERLSMTTAGARQHLSKLAEAGLVYGEDEIIGRGRPRRRWRLTQAGHDRFPDRHGDLTLQMIEATRAVFGEEGLDRLIAHREAETRTAYLAALHSVNELSSRVVELARLRESEGYMAEIQREPDGSFLLVENHCPICAAATACQGFCRAELALFRLVLGEGVSVEREDHLLAGARRCAYRIRRSAA